MSDGRTTLKELRVSKIILNDPSGSSGAAITGPNIVEHAPSLVKDQVTYDGGTESLIIRTTTQLAELSGEIWVFDLTANSVEFTVDAAPWVVNAAGSQYVSTVWLYITGGDGTKTLTLANGSKVTGLGQVWTPANAKKYVKTALVTDKGNGNIEFLLDTDL